MAEAVGRGTEETERSAWDMGGGNGAVAGKH